MLVEVIGWVMEKNFAPGRELSNAGKRDHTPSSLHWGTGPVSLRNIKEDVAREDLEDLSGLRTLAFHSWL